MTTAPPNALYRSLFFLVVVAVFSLTWSVARAQEIEACVGGATGLTTITNFNATDDAFELWGAAGEGCVANRVKGLGYLNSFTYYLLASTSGTASSVTAFVFDASASNAQVASVDISALLPASEDAIAVTATLASPVVLDPSHTYLLAFCSTAIGTRVYAATVLTSEEDSFRYCNGALATCACASGTWDQSLDPDPVDLETIIDGGCPSPSPSPSFSQTPTPSISQTPTPSSSQTPTPSTSQTPTPSTSQTPTPSVSQTPTPSISQTPTPSISQTPTPSSSQTPTPSISQTPTPSISQTPTPSSSQTPTPSTSRTPTPSTSQTPTPSISQTPTPSTSRTPTPSSSRTPSPSASRSPSPSHSPATCCVGPLRCV